MKRTEKQKNDLIDGSKFSAQFISNLFKYAKKYNVLNATLYEHIKDELFAEKIIKSIPHLQLFSGNDYLKLLSEGHDLEIDECDGSGLLSEATDIFAYIDPDFKGYGANEKGAPTKKTKTGVYELQKNSIFSTFFNSVGVDLNKLCFTQHQIKKFIQTHRNWLRTGGYATFFLFKSKVGQEEKFFVAHVNFDDDGRLEANINRVEYGLEWVAGCAHRVVLPELDVAL